MLHVRKLISLVWSCDRAFPPEVQVSFLWFRYWLSSRVKGCGYVHAWLKREVGVTVTLGFASVSFEVSTSTISKK